MSDTNHHSRRRFLSVLATAGLAGVALPTRVFTAGAQTQLPPTPACEDDDQPTVVQAEGPFYTPDSPRRTDLRETGIAGTPIVLTGFVLTRSCRPIPGALVDLWHADDQGVYDNVGYRLRGHQFADADGRYRFETIVPGLYSGRTRHFHVKFQAPNQPILTTQLYFPDEPANARDGIFRPELVVRISDGQERTAHFDGVLDIA